jgi:hypothetical protein
MLGTGSQPADQTEKAVEPSASGSPASSADQPPTPDKTAD